MKTRASLIFILICLLADDFLAYLLPGDPSYTHMTFVSHLGFLALMLVVLSQNWITRVLLSLLCGLVTDFFFIQSFPLHAILYPLAGYLCGWSAAWVQDHLLRRTGLVFGMMVFIDLLSFLWFSWMGNLSVSFRQWLMTYGLFSWVINGFLLLGLEYVLGVLDRYYTIRQNRIHRQERRKYRRLRFSQK